MTLNMAREENMSERIIHTGVLAAQRAQPPVAAS
jgi:hypothetical protein